MNLAGLHFLNSFRGTHPGDIKLNNILTHDGDSCILNTKNNGHGGEHWIGLYLLGDNIAFFDSYNRKFNTLNPLWKNNEWLQKNMKKLQSDYDTDCGQRCISFLMLMDKYQDPELIFKALK
jgi:hypothetical protein